MAPLRLDSPKQQVLPSSGPPQARRETGTRLSLGRDLPAPLCLIGNRSRGWRSPAYRVSRLPGSSHRLLRHAPINTAHHNEGSANARAQARQASPALPRWLPRHRRAVCEALHPARFLASCRSCALALATSSATREASGNRFISPTRNVRFWPTFTCRHRSFGSLLPVGIIE